MKKTLYLILFAIVPLLGIKAQQSLSFSEQIRTLQVTVNNDPLLPPFIELGKRDRITISFDELSHDYHRYIYHIQQCNADWTPTEGLSASDGRRPAVHVDVGSVP